MSGSVPRLPWRGAVLALAAVLCLLAAAPAHAAHRPRPTATPLWEAYPLAGKQATTGKQATHAATPPAGKSLGALHGRTRAGLLRGALVGGAALFAAFATPAVADEDESPRDISILNFVLNLEELQAVFYTETERNRILHGPLAQQAKVVGSHERAHARALRAVLGKHAVKRAHFDFGGTTEDPEAFRRTAVAFEDLSVAAYKAQAPKIVEREYLVSALAIHSVEARHAAWIRRLAGKTPVEGAFDEPISRAKTDAIVGRTHFVMAMTSTKGPQFTG